MARRQNSLNRLIPTLGLALIALLLFSGLAAGSASASEVKHWYACENIGLQGEIGAYTDSNCTNKTAEGKGYYRLTQLPAGVSTSFTSKNLTPITLSYSFGIENIRTIECATEAGSGSVLNPAGGGTGTLTSSGSWLNLTSCKYVGSNPGKCTVTEGKISSYGISGTISESTGKLTLVNPEGSGTIFSFYAPNCFPSGISVSGTLVGAMDNSLVFDGNSGVGLKGAGVSWSLVGTAQLKAGGKSILSLRY